MIAVANWKQTIASRISIGICGQCGKRPLVKNRKKCEDCLSRYNAYALKQMNVLQSNGLCVTCGQRERCINSKSRCEICLAKKRQSYLNAPEEHRVKHRIKNARWRETLKREVFEAYGGCTCICCGQTEIKFLCLDHVNNDGAKHRKIIGNGGDRILRWLKEQGFPKIVQVMCANCNQGKQLNKGLCPHKTENRINAA